MQIKQLLSIFNLFFAFFILFDTVIADNGTYRVFFKDKGDEEFFVGSKLYNETLYSLSKRALSRRQKNSLNDSIINYQDIDINPNYIKELEKLGCGILAKIKWENYCVISLEDSNKINIIKEYSFVKYIQKTQSRFTTLTNNNIININNDTQKLQHTLSKCIQIKDISNNIYGFSYDFLNLLNIDKVHNAGISGDSILVGFIDTGFRPNFFEAMKNITIVAERDFINQDDNTSNEDNDQYNQDYHGSMCLSLAVSNKPDEFIGASPNISVALAKTENLDYERKIEEDWFFEGVEWLESLGVDIISASLGYFKLDSSETQYSYDDLDGKTPICSKAVNYAVERGVLFVVAAGNNGPNSNSLNSPADADSAFSVGAIDYTNKVAKFSSRGTDGIGRVRPIIVAPGDKIKLPDPNVYKNYFTSSGTSLATPLIASSSALILSAFPELKTSEIKTLLIVHSDNFLTPNNDIGFGKPDVYSAMINNDIVISEMMTYPNPTFMKVIFKILYKNPIYNANLTIRENVFANAYTFPLKYFINDYFYADIPKSYFTKDTILAELLVNSIDGKQRRKPYYQNQFMYLINNYEKIPFGLSLDDFKSDISSSDNETFIFPTKIENNNSTIKLVTYSSVESPIYITIFDIIGNAVKTEYFPSVIGVFDRLIDINSLSSGLYFIQIRKKYSTEMIKFIIF